MSCDNAFVVTLLLLIFSMTGNFCFIIGWVARRAMQQFTHAEKEERNGSF